ncbi:hypothetical protein DPMN_015420 [Dreissena polymorpha]|uniref:Uncharacterized protein n=1 Tax=Dreissena polymorpha TaxID=45954 RepID=A0A9D4NBI7_DREPO|nr:hypothetical protein DPMN_015420 [Dreissena polymorpha]
MAVTDALDVTGRRLHPRDGFPSALSVLSTTAPGSLFKATLSMFLGAASTGPKPNPRFALYDLHTGNPAVPLFPSLFRRDLWQGQRALDDKQRLTIPLHLGEDSEPSSVETVRLEGGGRSGIGRARRCSPL